MANTPQPNPKLSDTQLVLLSAASQRDDGLLIPPETLKGAALAAALKALLKRGLVADVGAPCDQADAPLGSAERGRAKITRAGLDVLGIPADPDDTAVPHDTPTAAPNARRARRRTAGKSAPDTGQVDPAIEQPRPRNIKRALVVGLLSRESGATLDDLICATGWLPHTTRAALTGLRQSGCALERSKDAQGRTTYRIVGRPEAASVEQPAA